MGKRRIREEAGDIAYCLPSVLSAAAAAKAEAVAKDGGFHGFHG
jgi:hypothetical protein